MKKLLALLLCLPALAVAEAPNAVEQFKAEVHRQFASIGKDSSKCTFESEAIADEKDAFYVTVSCADQPFVCAFHVIPGAAAAIMCMDNPDYAPSKAPASGLKS